VVALNKPTHRGPHHDFEERRLADGKASGRPRSALDAIIVATAEANGCIVVTDNERDFAGIEIVNPLRGA
jgi:toxin FitB